MATYNLPFPSNVQKRVGRPTGEYAHENFPECRYAVDFIMETETPILATRSGKVFRIKSDSDIWGLDKELANEANYVCIQHDDDIYSEYVHLKKDSVPLLEGQEVSQGDIIGFTGLSGCMSTPHLHFNVFKIEDGQAISIPVDFD